MNQSRSKYIVIGAGLSGLTTAYELLRQGEDDFVILEGRKRTGGRINTHDGIDLGATWFQEHHELLTDLVDTLKLQKFVQFTKGKSVLVYNSMAPAHYFESDPNGPPAYRISGGSSALVDALANSVQNKIMLNSNVIGISEKGNLLRVQTENDTHFTEKVVITIPPRIVERINFSPDLPEVLAHTIAGTHTWMSNAIKVGITFNKPFWREKSLSGTVIGQIGPVIELYDHACNAGKTFGLMGFVNEGLRDESPENRKERILDYLEKHLGKEIRSYTNYYEKDWSEDPFTSCDKLKSVYMSPRYGDPQFQDFYMNDKLLFSGAETSPVYGGYMEGAVYSGLNAARKLLSK